MTLRNVAAIKQEETLDKSRLRERPAQSVGVRGGRRDQLILHNKNINKKAKHNKPYCT